MKKTIIISLINSKYVLKCDGIEITTIDTETLVLNGKDIYEKFFSKLELKENILIVVENDTSIIDSKDRRLTGDIKKIIERTVSLINNSLNLTGDEA